MRGSKNNCLPNLMRSSVGSLSKGKGGESGNNQCCSSVLSLFSWMGAGLEEHAEIIAKYTMTRIHSRKKRELDLAVFIFYSFNLSVLSLKKHIIFIISIV